MQIEICPCCGKPKKPKVISKWAERYPNGPQGNQFSVGEKPDGTRIGTPMTTAPATPAAATWEGYGSALKPAVEVIVMARKPVEGTIAENCERYGAGALAIDNCRITTEVLPGERRTSKPGGGHNGMFMPDGNMPAGERHNPAGRWPANLILDDSEAVTGLFPVTTSGARNGKHIANWDDGKQLRYAANDTGHHFEASEGSAARFFFSADWSLDQAEQLDAADVLRYCAKASRGERDAGLDDFEPTVSYRHNHNGRDMTKASNAMGEAERRRVERGEPGIKPSRNHHPTVKPLSLTRYLATLLLPPAAYAPRRILVPFGGVASEAIGAGLAGWDEIVVVESEREYCDIGEARLAYWLRQPELALR